MKVITDLHLHSRFSRAVSKDMNLPTMASWADKKGIGLLGTGDWTHPIWFREIAAFLKEKSEGIYQLIKGNNKCLFVLSTELSSIYSQGGKARRIHYLILSPNLDVSQKINTKLTKRGFNLLSDGRPILGISPKEIVDIVLEIDERCVIIPAHVWTPWFSLYGSVSGFDSIDECFGENQKYIKAVETGLSSDPAMNWRIEELTQRNIVSFGDAHSPAKLGREATVLEMEYLNFKNLREALFTRNHHNKILYTIEFYPEEGKYHFTGHRNCNVVYSPNETKKRGLICPVCGKKLTVGVMSRVEHLSTIEAEIETEGDNYGVRWIGEKNANHAPYIMLVPLLEIIAEAESVTAASKKVMGIYEYLTGNLGGEFNVLFKTDLKEIEKLSGTRVSEAIAKVRKGDIYIEPGYDGIFGKVRIWNSTPEANKSKQAIDQGALF